MPPRSSSEIGITVSIGLSSNKFLAKIASDLDKPRGFAVLGVERGAGVPRAEAGELHLRRRQSQRARAMPATAFAPSPTCSAPSETELMRRYGEEGRRLCAARPRHRRARRQRRSRDQERFVGDDASTSDIADFRALERILWSLTEKVSARLKTKELAGATVTLKLKTADFRMRTRARSLQRPTQLARSIFAAARGLLERETDGTRFRLLGVGVSALAAADEADPADLVDGRAAQRRARRRQRARPFRRRRRGPGHCVRGPEEP